MKRIGFLHTSAVHIPTFNQLLDPKTNELDLVHSVDEPLLAQAMREGINIEIVEQVHAHIQQLVADGCREIVCTCSTLGGVAEQIEVADVAISRIDRPMAVAAVQNAHVILIVASVGSTLIPTRELLLDESKRQARPIQIKELVLEHAWDAFLAGNLDEYFQTIADGIRTELAGSGGCVSKLPPEVIVLAQASMAGAADLLSDINLPILTSPKLCADSLLEK